MNSKHFYFAFIFLFLFLFPQTLSQDKKIKRYLFENAYVEKTTTTISQAMESTTTEKIYIAESGHKEAHFKNEKTNIKAINTKQESKSVGLLDGKWMINYDPDKKTGTKMANPFYDKFAGKSEKELKEFSKNIGDAFGTDIKKVGTGDVLGKTCEIYEGNTNLGGLKVKSKMWIYKNFVMKMESEGMGTKTTEFVTVYKEGAKPDAKLLTVPANIKITELKMPFGK
jgi:outer membrane lipoprotein-sorting protein